LLLPEPLAIPLLEPVLSHTLLLLQLCFLCTQHSLLPIQMLPILRQALLLLRNKLLLSLL
jgi:hypothetical protein